MEDHTSVKAAPDKPDSTKLTHGTRPRVFIADQSGAVIERLAATIDDVAKITGHATNAHDAISGIRKLNPDIAVFDIGIANGLGLLMQIKAHRPPPLVVSLTHSVEEATRRVCLRLGAEYFLDKLHKFNKVREIIIQSAGYAGHLQT
jgi:DNA-binding NarL/FixJ family response regulator